MSLIVIAGTTGVDGRPTSPKEKSFEALLSGGGAFGAIGVGQMKNPHIHVTLVTTFSQAYGGEINLGIRKALNEFHVYTVSDEASKPPFSIFNSSERDAGNIVSRIKDKNADALFAQTTLSTTENLRPTVIVFIGSALTNPATYKSMLQSAKNARDKGSLVIVDMNPRKDVPQDITKQWAKVAHILKVSDRDLPYLFADYDQKSGKDPAVRKLLDMGSTLVFVTAGQEGSNGFWLDHSPSRAYDPVKRHDVPSTHPNVRHCKIPVVDALDLKERAMGGDPYTTGLAYGYVRILAAENKRQYPRTFENLLTTRKGDFVGRLGRYATIGARKFLEAANDKGNDRPHAFRPLATAGTMQALVNMVYPDHKL